MKYPMLCPWVELSVDTDGLHLTDPKRNKRFRTHPKYEALLRRLDGRTSPRQLAPELSGKDCAFLLENLKLHHLSRQHPAFSADFPSLYFTIPLPRPGAIARGAAHVFNNTLLKLWLPSLLLSIWFLHSCPIVLLDNHIWLGSIGGMLLGILLHELAHACACLSYGGKVSAWGLTLFCLLPGAFVELDTGPVKHPLQRAQIFAAGAEINLLLCSFFLILSGCSPLLGTPCFCAAISNAMMALLNLTLTFGLDGSHILSSLLDVDDICALAIDILFDRRNRRHLGEMGISGRAALSLCGMGLVMLGFLPLILIVNICEVFLWVF